MEIILPLYRRPKSGSSYRSCSHCLKTEDLASLFMFVSLLSILRPLVIKIVTQFWWVKSKLSSCCVGIKNFLK